MKLKKIFAVLYIPIIICNVFVIQTHGVGLEIPEATYYGWGQADAVYQNIDFTDVAAMADTHWAKPVIYEMAALNVFKGYGNKTFGSSDYVSKEQAIALIYRITGKEEQAQKAGEEIENNRMDDDKLGNAIDIWSDGYLKIASQEGLITEDDFNDAIDTEQSFVQFKRTEPTSREEIARWAVMALGIKPAYPQQFIFNSYKDWHSADALKVPYIEAALQAGIMKGTEQGYFYPTKGINRQEMAQVLKNMLDTALPTLKLDKHFGIIECIEKSNIEQVGQSTIVNSFDLRMSDGKLHEMITTYEVDMFDGHDNKDITDGFANINTTDVIVYKNGRVGKSAILREGDSIEFLTDENKAVRYVKVLDSSDKPVYIAAKIKNADVQNRLVSVEWMGNIPEPSYAGIPIDVDDTTEGFGKTVTYGISANAGIVIGGRISDLGDITPGMHVVLTVRTRVIYSVVTAVFNIDADKDIVSGIVEENNPALGYISLYSEDGSSRADRFRVFYYNLRDVDVLRDYKQGTVNDVKPGDTAFIKLAIGGSVISISARNNYISKYATIISKNLGSITVKYDDGAEQIFAVNPDILVISDKRIIDYAKVKDGDRVRLTLNEQEGINGLRQMTVEVPGRYVSGIYRAKLSYIDDMTGKVIWHDVEKLDSGRWVKQDYKGNYSMSISEGCEFLYRDKTIGADTINKYMKDCSAYIAAETVQGGSERAVLITIKDDADREIAPINDTIAAIYEATKDMAVSKSADTYKYTDGTIIIKDGRLIKGTGIAPDDEASIIANRNDSTGDLIAKIVNVTHKQRTDSFFIYRGRISDINENIDFTVESYATFDGTVWHTTLAEKTFEISYKTRILDDDGPVSIRDFIAYGKDSYKNKTVYIIVKDSETILLSTAPYVTYSVKGEVLLLQNDETTNELTGFTLHKAKLYDTQQRKWLNCEDVQIIVPINGIVIKNDNVCSASSIRKGYAVKVVKTDKTLSGNGYIIFIE